MVKKYQSIPTPKTDLPTLVKSITAIRNVLNEITGQTGANKIVTQKDLLNQLSKISGIQKKEASLFETWEDATSENWYEYNGAASVEFPQSGLSGGNVFRADGYTWRVSKTLVPYNSGWLYRITARVRRSVAATIATKEKLYIGVTGVASDGVTLVNANGADSYSSQHYIAASDYDMTAHAIDEWVVFNGYFRGYGAVKVSADPNSPSQLHANVAYIRPTFVLGYQDGDGVSECDFISVSVVEEAATGNVTITQATEPTDSDCFTLYGRNLIVGDIWEDSDDGNKRYRYDGADFVYQKNYSSWPEVQDTAGTKPADNATATGIDNLILNGDLELENNTNWGGEQYRAGGFSSWAKQGHIETDALANVVDKYIPVDTNDAYEIEAVVGAEQAGSTGYVGVQCYDENKVLIKAWESYFLANTNTTIFEAASAGATSIKIVPPATSWNPVDIYYYAHLDAAVDGSHLPSRSTVNLTQNGVVDNTTFHTVSLAEPLPEAVSVGQVVALSRSVSNYPYIYSNQPISQQTLTRHSGVLIGENGINEVLPNTKFRAGTKFVKPFVYLNRTVAGTSRVTKLSIRKLGAKLSGIEDGATLGADWGANTANRPVNLRDLTGLEAILNGDITISVDGQLLGGGGGQVTINGLGYTGALNANYITNTSELTDGAQLGLTSLWAGVPDRPANLA
ncbi:MAG: hypothetical protein OEZ33_08705, partial [Gammaproteobacteria bacterium]|nr:hypothetical protein [Gammaproteobacteria bacterium]